MQFILVLVSVTFLFSISVLANDSSINEKLIDSAKLGDVDGVELYLKLGADPNYQNSSKRTALMIAAHLGNYSVLEVLLADSRTKPGIGDFVGQTALHFAADSGWVKIVKMLKNAGARVNSRTDAGYSPLMYAAESGQLSVVETLLQLRASVLPFSNYCKDALRFAMKTGITEMVKLLRDHGAKERECKESLQ